MADADLYDYELPRELIAQEPLADRSAARLLVVDRATGGLHHRHVRDLPQILRPGDAVSRPAAPAPAYQQSGFGGPTSLDPLLHAAATRT